MCGMVQREGASGHKVVHIHKDSDRANKQDRAQPLRTEIAVGEERRDDEHSQYGMHGRVEQHPVMSGDAGEPPGNEGIAQGCGQDYGHQRDQKIRTSYENTQVAITAG